MARPNEIRGGRASGRGFGLSVDGSERLVVADTELSGVFGEALVLAGNRARIVRSRIEGFFTARTELVARVVGSGNRIAENEIIGAGTKVLVAGSGNELIENVVSGDGPSPAEADGILVTGFGAGTLLRGNRAHDNSDDGIDVRSTSTRLRDNTATGNGDFGIDAVEGVTDQGGNAASGNGNALQCRNVFCQ